MSKQHQTAVKDQATVDFWNGNFGKLESVRTSEFATAFVKRFQDGKDGFPVYPAEILYRVIDHFIARHNDLKAEDQITTKDLLTFVTRFGSLKTAVNTVTENFFDPNGEVHLWYHFDVTPEVMNRKFVLESRNSFAVMDHDVRHDNGGNHKLDVFSGDLALRLRRVGGAKVGKKEEHIERVKDSNGKVTYWGKVVMADGAPKAFDKPQQYKSLLKHLEERTAEYVPLRSSLWVGLHSVETKRSDGTSEFKTGDGEDDGLTKEAKANMWKGYSPVGQKVTTVAYAAWESQRAEQAKVASSRYRQWQSAYATDLVKTADEQQPVAVLPISPTSTGVHSDSGKYVQVGAILNTPH